MSAEMFREVTYSVAQEACQRLGRSADLVTNVFEFFFVSNNTVAVIMFVKVKTGVIEPILLYCRDAGWRLVL